MKKRLITEEKAEQNRSAREMRQDLRADLANLIPGVIPVPPEMQAEINRARPYYERACAEWVAQRELRDLGIER